MTPSSGSQTVGHGSVVETPAEARVVEMTSLPLNNVTFPSMTSSVTSYDASSDVVVTFDVTFVMRSVDAVAHNDLDTNFVSSSKNLGTLYRTTNTATGIRNIHALGLYLIHNKDLKISCWSSGEGRQFMYEPWTLVVC